MGVGGEQEDGSEVTDRHHKGDTGGDPAGTPVEGLHHLGKAGCKAARFSLLQRPKNCTRTACVEQAQGLTSALFGAADHCKRHFFATPQ